MLIIMDIKTRKNVFILIFNKQESQEYWNPLAVLHLES